MVVTRVGLVDVAYCLCLWKIVMRCTSTRNVAHEYKNYLWQ